MRVLVLNYEYPPIGGGAATASAHIVDEMVSRGVEVAVLTSHFRGLPKREKRGGYTIYRVPALRVQPDRCSLAGLGAYMVSAALPALRLASDFKPDLMHVYFGMPTGPVGLLVNLMKGVPYLLSLRGGDVPGFSNNELRLIYWLTAPVTKAVWSKASILVANSNGLRNLAARTMPKKTIEVIPNGVDLHRFRTAPGTAPVRSGSRVRLLFVGRLTHQKGLPFLFEAIAALPSNVRARIDLNLVGGGPEFERLSALVSELEIESSVRFTGWLTRDRIPAAMQEADLFVLPSLYEGMPNVVLEAMACGKAILATDVSGIQELVTPRVNGLLVSPGDVAALSHALQELVGEPTLLERMGRASRKLAEQRGWDTVAERYISLSEQLLVPDLVPVPTC